MCFLLNVEKTSVPRIRARLNEERQQKTVLAMTVINTRTRVLRPCR